MKLGIELFLLGFLAALFSSADGVAPATLQPLVQNATWYEHSNGWQYVFLRPDGIKHVETIFKNQKKLDLPFIDLELMGRYMSFAAELNAWGPGTINRPPGGYSIEPNFPAHINAPPPANPPGKKKREANVPYITLHGRLILIPKGVNPAPYLPRKRAERNPAIKKMIANWREMGLVY